MRELVGQRVRLLEVQQAHLPELRRIRATPEVTSRWGAEGLLATWPHDDDAVTPWSVVFQGSIVGMVQYGEEVDPMYRHASIDIFLDSSVHGRGVGRDAVRTLSRYLFEVRGHHRIVIDPAADNEAAIRCYAAVGFRRVGVMRRYERDAGGDGWHDGLLMELLVEDLQ